jgi:hypothetical protein
VNDPGLEKRWARGRGLNRRRWREKGTTIVMNPALPFTCWLRCCAGPGDASVCSTRSCALLNWVAYRNTSKRLVSTADPQAQGAATRPLRSRGRRRSARPTSAGPPQNRSVERPEQSNGIRPGVSVSGLLTCSSASPPPPRSVFTFRPRAVLHSPLQVSLCAWRSTSDTHVTWREGGAPCHREAAPRSSTSATSVARLPGLARRSPHLDAAPLATPPCPLATLRHPKTKKHGKGAPFLCAATDRSVRW